MSAEKKSYLQRENEFLCGDGDTEFTFFLSMWEHGEENELIILREIDEFL